jgi:SAM-dependent methyltransferase
MSSPEPDSIAANIAEWTEANAQHTDGAAGRQWAREEMAWGVFGVPESAVGCIGDVAGLDVVELGCGTAYVSAFGASLWADPETWVPEAARLLRPGGRLIFLTNSNLSILPMPDTGPVGTTLVRPLFGLGRMQWPGEHGIEYHLPHGRWIELLREQGFEIVALHELQAPADAEDPVYYDYVTVEWARRWPAEEIWVARKPS